MFDLMLRERTPMLFHCTQGKDRTGVAAILIMLALGVDEETILDDYVLTNKYRRKLIESSLNKHRILTRISKNARSPCTYWYCHFLSEFTIQMLKICLPVRVNPFRFFFIV